ncbi:hypothetical protein H238_1681 [Klebsiella pneumoniae UHKPC179]|nr:hypothetical protein CSC13_2939 [Klebsiella pneumoniae]EPA87303.1 hypothetical protein H237_2681 [Klebsiella pneumoniae UHKPC57]EPO87733.1 hypothetical protein H238_1681 [Klebsiella pneumoniae UHKPC179]
MIIFFIFSPVNKDIAVFLCKKTLTYIVITYFRFHLISASSAVW